MKRRVFIIHGWDGYPEEGWFPWLKKELEKKEFEVIVPQMQHAANPRIYNWVSKISSIVKSPDKNTYFVGHSIGCQAIARYLEGLPQGTKIGGAVFVAGFFKRLTGLEEDPDVQKTDRHWLTTPIDFKKVKSKIKKSIAIFSDNDPWVPLDNQDDFREKLGSKIIIEHNMGHFSASDYFKEEEKVKKLPVVLESVLELTNG